MSTLHVTERTKIRRLPKRGSYERDVIDAILDEALVCHVGFVHDGAPFVIPTTFVRIDDRVFVHGAAASRMLVAISDHALAVTVTLVDGLVLARSAFHHSMNYRSVVILGRGIDVGDHGRDDDGAVPVAAGQHARAAGRRVGDGLLDPPRLLGAHQRAHRGVR